MLSNILCTNQQISEEEASFNYKQHDSDEVQTFENNTYSHEFVIANNAKTYSPICLSKIWRECQAQLHRVFARIRLSKYLLWRIRMNTSY